MIGCERCGKCECECFDFYTEVKLCNKCYSTEKCDCNKILYGKIEDFANTVSATTVIDYVAVTPKTISWWVKDSYETSKAKGWHDADCDASFVERLALMHSEISEALEEYRNGKGYTEIYYNPEKPDKPEGIAIELADIVIRVMDACGKHGIDLEKAMELKSAYNKTRPHRHGNKKI